MSPGDVAELLGYIVAAVTSIHAILALTFRHTSFLDEKKENAVLNFLGMLTSGFSLLNGRSKK